MKKADLITLHSVYNYGSVLQAYATQKIFKKHNVDIEVINYIRPNNSFLGKLKEYGNSNIIKEFIVLPSLMRQKVVFDSFCKRYLNLSKKTYKKVSDFDNYNSNAGFYITGSDQVWNSKWNDGIIEPLYLSFVKNKYKFAFASSFGQEKLEKEELLKTKKLINDYDLISVREKSAVNILKEQYKFQNVIQILDPTLLLTSDEWLQISDKKFKKNGYILVYQLNSNKKMDKYIKEVAKFNNKKVIRICRRFDQIILNGKSCLIPNVNKFISLFNNASMVITDSFHALSFSINLNIPFMCIYPNKFSTRLSSCLEMFDLNDRHVIDYNDFDVFSKKINWNAVNEKLTLERQKANDYIEECIRIAEGEKNDLS